MSSLSISTMNIGLFLVLFILSIVFLSSYAEDCKGGVCAAFNVLGYPVQRDVVLQSIQQKATLPLIAAGTRRKKIVFIEVDVYNIGLYCDSSYEGQVLESGGSASDKIAKLSHGSDGISLVLSLSFLRSLSTSTIVDAMADSLSAKKAVSSETVTHFSGLLETAVGKKGLAKDDTIEFVYHGASQMTIFVRGHEAGMIDDLPLREVLLSIYTGKDSITPSVVDILTKKYSL